MNDNNKNNINQPDDPTTHGDDFLADPTGLTGVTQSTTNLSNNSTDDQKMSDQAFDSAQDTAEGKDGNNVNAGKADVGEEIVRLNDLEDGEESASGTEPAPESDDDVLANAQNMGIALEEDPEHPKELNIADDIDKAEEYKRTH